MIIYSSSRNSQGGIIKRILFIKKKKNIIVDTHKQFTKDKTKRTNMCNS